MQNEVRLARAEMTKALVAMCARLDESGVSHAQYTHEYAGDVISLFTPARLWVFGSYARGATECGDLDVLIELDYQAGPCPPAEVVANVLFGEVGRLSLFLGTPEQNKAGFDITDAVLIWSGKGSYANTVRPSFMRTGMHCMGSRPIFWSRTKPLPVIPMDLAKLRRLGGHWASNMPFTAISTTTSITVALMSNLGSRPMVLVFVG